MSRQAWLCFHLSAKYIVSSWDSVNSPNSVLRMTKSPLYVAVMCLLSLVMYATACSAVVSFFIFLRFCQVNIRKSCRELRFQW